MFDKHKSNKQNTPPPEDSFELPDIPPPPIVSEQATTRLRAMIGPTIKIKGDISGDENLTIEGNVEGSVVLASHEVCIGQSGHVNADVTAKIIKIEGEVKGDITGNEKVVVSKTGNVRGNIVAPRVTLEDGAKFKGSIDMDPGGAASSVSSLSTHSVAGKASHDKVESGTAAKSA
jgi:cytoskeletal protein CcmA (bactofilin family)